MPLQAQLGYVGWVTFGGTKVRATSCDIRLTQTVDTQDVVDGKIDRTVYKLNPFEVGGSVAFPGVHEDLANNAIETLWKNTLQRDAFGQMVWPGSVYVKYATGVAFNFGECFLNTYEWNVAQSDVLNITVGVYGSRKNKGRTPGDGDAEPFYNLRNSRVVTWNDCSVSAISGLDCT
jgi:hypothetical protein